MKEIACKNHSLQLTIPTTEDEFRSGKYHQDVEHCQAHHEEYPECKFEEVLN